MNEDKNIARLYELIAIRDSLKWWQVMKRVRIYFRIDFEIERLREMGYL